MVLYNNKNKKMDKKSIRTQLISWQFEDSQLKKTLSC